MLEFTDGAPESRLALLRLIDRSRPTILSSERLVTHSSFDPPEEAEWHRRIAEAAYVLAEKRGFEDGAALQDWLAAEEAMRHSLVDVDRPQSP
jgi:hypothetical protein